MYHSPPGKYLSSSQIECPLRLSVRIEMRRSSNDIVRMVCWSQVDEAEGIVDDEIKEGARRICSKKYVSLDDATNVRKVRYRQRRELK
jgi:hypothetical protein